MLRRSEGRPRLPRAFGQLAPARLTLTHGLMIVSALVTFVSVSSVLQDRSDTVDVFVARSSIDDGAIVRAENLATVAVSTQHPLVDHLLPVAAFGEGLARRPIAVGEPVLRSDILPPETSIGGRTFTVPVDDRVIEGLALRQGDRVDVVGIGSAGEIEIVAFDLEVARLPTGTNASGLAGSLGSSFVTVKVTPAEVLHVVAALQIDQVEIVRSTGAPPVVAPTPDVSLSGDRP